MSPWDRSASGPRAILGRMRVHSLTDDLRFFAGPRLEVLANEHRVLAVAVDIPEEPGLTVSQIDGKPHERIATATGEVLVYAGFSLEIIDGRIVKLRYYDTEP